MAATGLGQQADSKALVKMADFALALMVITCERQIPATNFDPFGMCGKQEQIKIINADMRAKLGDKHEDFVLRMGIEVGPAVAGVIGRSKVCVFPNLMSTLLSHLDVRFP